VSQADKWAMHLAAARQYYEGEGHLRVPRKHVETIRVCTVFGSCKIFVAGDRWRGVS
jgi:hypothetical protein